MTEAELKRYDDLAMRVDASAPVGSLEETLAIAARKLIKEIRQLGEPWKTMFTLISCKEGLQAPLRDMTRTCRFWSSEHGLSR